MYFNLKNQNPYISGNLKNENVIKFDINNIGINNILFN